VTFGNDIIFVQRLGKVLRNYYYRWDWDKYIGEDISLMAEHLLNRGNITELAWQQTPHKICWAIRSDGYLLGLTLMPEHEVVGWHQHPPTGTDAEFESIAVIEGAEEDELWAIVKRTVNSATVRYVERMKPLIAVDTGEGSSDDWALTDSFFVDSGLTYRGSAATVISGLGHLEGEAVVALADGLVVTGLTVSSGAITLATAAEVIHIGLNYNADLETLDLVIDDREGTGQGLLKSIDNVILRLYRSLNGQVGPDTSNLDSIPYDDSSNFYTGDTRDLSVYGGTKQNPVIYIRQNEPLPMSVLAIITETEI
jgi:hypothetical protein